MGNSHFNQIGIDYINSLSMDYDLKEFQLIDHNPELKLHFTKCDWENKEFRINDFVSLIQKLSEFNININNFQFKLSTFSGLEIKNYLNKSCLIELKKLNYEDLDFIFKNNCKWSEVGVTYQFISMAKIQSGNNFSIKIEDKILSTSLVVYNKQNHIFVNDAVLNSINYYLSKSIMKENYENVIDNYNNIFYTQSSLVAKFLFDNRKPDDLILYYKKTTKMGNSVLIKYICTTNSDLFNLEIFKKSSHTFLFKSVKEIDQTMISTDEITFYREYENFIFYIKKSNEYELTFLKHPSNLISTPRPEDAIEIRIRDGEILIQGYIIKTNNFPKDVKTIQDFCNYFDESCCFDPLKFSEIVCNRITSSQLILINNNQFKELIIRIRDKRINSFKVVVNYPISRNSLSKYLSRFHKYISKYNLVEFREIIFPNIYYKVFSGKYSQKMKFKRVDYNNFQYVIATKLTKLKKNPILYKLKEYLRGRLKLTIE